MAKVWLKQGSKHYASEVVNQQSHLENGIYRLEIDEFGRFYLLFLEEKFNFSYKIYGLEEKLIKRTLRSYSAIDNNVGILLNGTKGTGKTVTSKMICNEVDQPGLAALPPPPRHPRRRNAH